MNWNDLKTLWDRQRLPAGPGADASELKRTFETKRRRLARSLFWRDTIEASAGVFVAGVFAYAGWHMGSAGWPVALAVVIMLGLTGFFVRERLRAHRQRVGADAPLLEKLEAEVAELRRQRDLLLNVGWWYFAPCVIAAAIVAGTAMALSPVPIAVQLKTGWLVILLFALVGWRIWALNRRVVRKQITPRLQELEKLYQSLSFS